MAEQCDQFEPARENAEESEALGVAGLHRLMALNLGAVPDSIADPIYDDGNLQLSMHEFRFVTPGGAQFHYALGRGLTAEAPSPALREEFDLFLWGTVYGAVAWFNRYFVLHASAVTFGDRVVAFTADSGGGKSTLAAALASRGHLHVCDDTLALFQSGQGVLAVPDGKPQKLWEDAVQFVGTQRRAPVWFQPGKFYVQPDSVARDAFPLTDLIVLQPGQEVSIVPVRGVAKLPLIVDAMYRPVVPAALNNRDQHRSWLLTLADEVRVWRLSRPINCLEARSFEMQAELISRETTG